MGLIKTKPQTQAHTEGKGKRNADLFSLDEQLRGTDRKHNQKGATLTPEAGHYGKGQHASEN